MNQLLNIADVHASVDGKLILNGLSLTVNAGEVHAIMGPNGAGKSTLGHVLAGRDGYDVSAGAITLNGEDLLAMTIEQRATSGLFLSFQYPVEIPGVSNLAFLKACVNAQRKQRGLPEIAASEFLSFVRAQAKTVGIDAAWLQRGVNEGFSGGEKKRNEILQMLVLQPSMMILDETDSGLDIDALKVVADGINAMRSPHRGMIMVTHYQRLLDYVRPDFVHVLAKGRIVRSGGPELALELEEKGYGWLDEAA